MSRQLSTAQAKVGHKSDEDIVRMVRHKPRRSIVYDTALPCHLMAKDSWTKEKCVAYSSSGSFTCMTCHFRPALRTCHDPLQIYDAWEKAVRSIPRKQQQLPPVPAVIKYKEKNVMANKKGICSHCEQERTLVAKGKCFNCNYGPNAAMTKEEVMEKFCKPNALSKIRPTAATLEERGMSSMGFSRNEQTAITIGIRDEDKELFNRISERARANRRDPASEILMLADMALTSGCTTETIEIGKMRKIVERMKTYPVPNGSPKEVFAEAFNMVLLRLAEMEG